jgi:geranylgeranyl pyrophosphate synthase
VGGQALDLAAAGSTGIDAPSPTRLAATVPEAAVALEDMHRRKTGALIRAASVIGVLLAGGGEDAVSAVDAYARDLGLAFQIIDDVLDVEGSAGELGKTAGKDAAAGKLTFPSLYGLEPSRRMAADCVAQARAALAGAGLSGRLDDIAIWSLGRQR